MDKQNLRMSINPFTAAASKISTLKGARMRLQTVLFSRPLASTFIAIRNYESPFTCQ